MTRTSTRNRHHAATAAFVGFLAIELVLILLAGHRGTHAARDLLVPGAGVVDTHPWVTVGFVALTVAATVTWLRWGADWTLVATVLAAVVTTFTITPAADAAAAWSALTPARAAHEFPLVVIVAGALSWLRSVLVRVPGLRRVLAARSRARHGLDDLPALAPVARARAVALLAIAGDDIMPLRSCLDASDVARRARRIGIVARGRFGGDPFRRDHAHARAARLLAGIDTPTAATSLRADAARSPLGLPCSEPTWVRPLDAVLAAFALQRAGDPTTGVAVRDAYAGPWRLRGKRRPAWTWTPALVSAGSAPAWEHAAATGLARAAGWIAGDTDWAALRKRALGAAARGTAHPDDERLIAAARVWLTVVDDAEAARLLTRPTVQHDPVAIALDRVAARLRAEPSALRAG